MGKESCRMREREAVNCFQLTTWISFKSRKTRPRGDSSPCDVSSVWYPTEGILAFVLSSGISKMSAHPDSINLPSVLYHFRMGYTFPTLLVWACAPYASLETDARGKGIVPQDPLFSSVIVYMSCKCLCFCTPTPTQTTQPTHTQYTHQIQRPPALGNFCSVRHSPPPYPSAMSCVTGRIPISYTSSWTCLRKTWYFDGNVTKICVVSFRMCWILMRVQLQIPECTVCIKVAI